MVFLRFGPYSLGSTWSAPRGERATVHAALDMHALCATCGNFARRGGPARVRAARASQPTQAGIHGGGGGWSAAGGRPPPTTPTEAPRGSGAARPRGAAVQTRARASTHSGARVRTAAARTSRWRLSFLTWKNMPARGGGGGCRACDPPRPPTRGPHQRPLNHTHPSAPTHRPVCTPATPDSPVLPQSLPLLPALHPRLHPRLPFFFRELKWRQFSKPENQADF